MLRLSDWNRPVPRYTSYPSAPHFYPFQAGEADEAFRALDESRRPLSLYVHIPFCRTMCLFCACSVILNRRPEKQAAYVDLLIREIALLAEKFSRKRVVSQLHFGGGTPTLLEKGELERIMREIASRFEIAPFAECSIEIDPRTVYADRGDKLRFLRALGFNRASFGVQDLDPKVQEAVRRRQSEEMTVSAYRFAREAGFPGVNLDLIYGLPYQTLEGFSRTVAKIVALKPDRVALFSYAKVPWLKLHQAAMPEEAEPSAEEKFRIYLRARELFLAAGYEGIGMDHFALSNDSLAQAYREGTLWRNFQGYSVKLAEDLAGLGVTSIGFVNDTFLQNAKTITEYEQDLAANRLPIARGFVLSPADRKRCWAIQTLMCRFSLDKQEFERLFHAKFDEEFASSRQHLDALRQDGLLEEDAGHLLPTETGRLLIRLVASAFDAYLKPGANYSRAI